jgi:prepilin-type N-terminal cleavage/methylation domain-containing protein
MRNNLHKQNGMGSRAGILGLRGTVAFPGSRFGFTLTELLVVIAIIALLAGLIIGVFPMVNQSRVRSRAQAEMANLTAMIEHYKSKKGHYPLDGRTNLPIVTPKFFNVPATLYHELTSEPPAANVFIVNSGQEKQNFARNLKDSQYREVDGYRLLGIPTKGPEGDFSFWRYDASSTNRHNPEGFDLWIDVFIKGEKHTFKNWSGE